MNKRQKYIRLNDLSQPKRTELRVKTLALLRFNHCNVGKTSRESHVNESTIRAWLREDNEVARAISEERRAIQEKERQALQAELTETKQINELHQAKLVSEQVERITELAIDRVTVLANELVESLMTSLLTDKVKFYDRMLAFGILFDKIQIFQGNPTSISASLGRRLTREQRAERAAQLMKTAEERRKQLKVVPSNATQEKVSAQ